MRMNTLHHVLKSLYIWHCHSIQIYDYEHKEDLETGDNKLYVLLERGECDLEHIVHKLVNVFFHAFS